MSFCRTNVVKTIVLVAIAWSAIEGAITVSSLRTASAADPNAYAMVMNNHLKVAVSVIWEGRHMHHHNIEALREFRRQFTDVAVIHFVSPAYFLHEDAASAMEQFRATLQKQDHVALLLSGWKSMTSQAGVAFRDAPTFFGAELRPENCAHDCGLEVPLSIYSADEIEKIVAFGRETLTRNGLGSPISAMVSGWSSSPALLNALAKAGIRYDFTAVAPDLIKSRLQHFPIFDWVAQQWGNITPYTQPYLTATKPEAITGIPQNLAAIDYLTPTDITPILENYARTLKQDPSADLVFHLTMYQETAQSTLPKMSQILQNIFAYAAQNGLNIRHLDLPESGVRDKYAIEPLRYAPPKRFVH